MDDGNKDAERCSPNDRKRCRIRDRSQIPTRKRGRRRGAARNLRHPSLALRVSVSLG
jgi:hypothetical protein